MAGPASPADPEDPVDPIDPEDPEDPNDPEDPEDPADPVDPEDPADPEPPEDPEDPADPEPAPRPPSRAARRIQSLSDRLDKAERELSEARRRPAAPDPNARAAQEARERQEEEAVRLRGDPAEISQFYANRAQQQIRSEVGVIAGHLADQADRTAFTTLANSNSVYAAVADEVEERLANARAQGMNPQRIAIAHVLLGEKVAKRAGAAKTRATKRAAVNNDRQRGRPGGGGRSDATTGRRPTGDTHAKRGKRLDESEML